MTGTNLTAAAFVSVWSSATGHAMPPFQPAYRDPRGPARAARIAVRAR